MGAPYREALVDQVLYEMPSILCMQVRCPCYQASWPSIKPASLLILVLSPLRRKCFITNCKTSTSSSEANMTIYQLGVKTEISKGRCVIAFWHSLLHHGSAAAPADVMMHVPAIHLLNRPVQSSGTSASNSAINLYQTC